MLWFVCCLRWDSSICIACGFLVAEHHVRTICGGVLRRPGSSHVLYQCRLPSSHYVRLSYNGDHIDGFRCVAALPTLVLRITFTGHQEKRRQR